MKVTKQKERERESGESRHHLCTLQGECGLYFVSKSVCSSLLETQEVQNTKEPRDYTHIYIVPIDVGGLASQTSTSENGQPVQIRLHYNGYIMDKYKDVPPVINFEISRPRLNQIAVTVFVVQLLTVLVSSLLLYVEFESTTTNVAHRLRSTHCGDIGAGDDNGINLCDTQLMLGTHVLAMALVSSILACRIVASCLLAYSRRVVDMVCFATGTTTILLPTIMVTLLKRTQTTTTTVSTNIEQRIPSAFPLGMVVTILIVAVIAVTMLSRHYASNNVNKTTSLSALRSSVHVALTAIQSTVNTNKISLSTIMYGAPVLHCIWMIVWFIGITGLGRIIFFGNGSNRLILESNEIYSSASACSVSDLAFAANITSTLPPLNSPIRQSIQQQDDNQSLYCLESAWSSVPMNDSDVLAYPSSSSTTTAAKPTSIMVSLSKLVIEYISQQYQQHRRTYNDDGSVDCDDDIVTSSSLNSAVPIILRIVTFVMFVFLSSYWTYHAYRNLLCVYTSMTVHRWWNHVLSTSGNNNKMMKNTMSLSSSIGNYHHHRNNDNNAANSSRQFCSVQVIGSILLDSLYAETLQYIRMLVKYRPTGMFKTLRMRNTGGDKSINPNKGSMMMVHRIHKASTGREVKASKADTGIDLIDEYITYATNWTFVNVGLSLNVQNTTLPIVSMVQAGGHVHTILEREDKVELYERGTDMFSGSYDWIIWVMVRFIVASTSLVLALVMNVCLGYMGTVLSSSNSSTGHDPIQQYQQLLLLASTSFVVGWTLSDGCVVIFESAQRAVLMCLVQSLPPEDDFHITRLAFGLKNALKEANPRLWKSSSLSESTSSNNK